MLYVTGIFALNLRCRLDTCGDWHAASLNWPALKMRESEAMPWKNWGIETGRRVPGRDGLYAIADHLRALLDMIYDGQFGLAGGMKDDFICNDFYTPIVFERVLMLKDHHRWSAIDKFMDKEYPLEWHNFLRSKKDI